jgi:hypothetical protein
MKAKGRNDVESYLYSSRSNIFEEEKYKNFFTTEDSEKIKKTNEEVDNWLNFGESDDASVEMYEEKLKLMKAVVDPIYERYEEFEKRKKEISVCLDGFNKTTQVVKLFEEKFPQITREEIDDLINLNSKTQKWLQEKIEKQSGTALNLPPVVTSEEIKLECYKILQKSLILSKKPPLKPVEVINNNTTESNSTQPEEKKKDEL